MANQGKHVLNTVVVAVYINGDCAGGKLKTLQPVDARDYDHP